MYITPNVPTIDSGTATAGITVARTDRRNRKITITTSAMVSISSNSTSFTDARMVFVRSVKISRFTPAGSDCLSCGKIFCTAFTTPMMFAPGCRWIFRITAGLISRSRAGASPVAGSAAFPIHAA